jgi:hypothetical protein
LERLRRDLPIVGEATHGRLTPSYRKRLGNGYVDILIRYRWGLYGRYYRINDSFTPNLRAIKTCSVRPVHSLWTGCEEPELINRLSVSEAIISAWCVDEVAPEVVLEELQTAAELLLKKNLGMPEKIRFPELVKHARRRRFLRGDPLINNYRIAEDALTPQQLLKSLGEVRNGSKHGGKSGAREWLEKHFWAATAVLESLSEG